MRNYGKVLPKARRLKSKVYTSLIDSSKLLVAGEYQLNLCRCFVLIQNRSCVQW